jgi:hypothetical protein
MNSVKQIPSLAAQTIVAENAIVGVIWTPIYLARQLSAKSLPPSIC